MHDHEGLGNIGSGVHSLIALIECAYNDIEMGGKK